VGRDKIRAPLKSPAWEATASQAGNDCIGFVADNNIVKLFLLAQTVAK